MKSAVLLPVILTLGIGAAAQPVSTDTAQTSPTGWTGRAWGKVGVPRLENAPYPDDSRTTGFTSKSGFFPKAGHYDDNTVVFAVPSGFRPSSSVDLIVHFHGHRNRAPLALEQFRLGEMLQGSGRNAILILPQGPKDAPDSGCGRLEKPGMFAAFVDEAVAWLVSEKRLPAGAKARNIILSGHSGGYRVMGMILDHGGEADRIKEAWLWDAAYAQWDEIAGPFASPNPGKKLRSIFTDHLATENVEIMSRLCLRGAPVFVVEDDHLTTAGTTGEAYHAFRYRGRESKPGEEELPALLRRHQNLFIHTQMTHGNLIWEKKYFEVWARESSNLRAVK